MNEPIETVMLAHASSGKRIVLVAASWTELRAEFLRLADASFVERVIRANGREQICFKSGGEIRFVCSNGGAGRGLTADVVVVRDWDDLSVSQQEDIMPMIARGGELVRA